MSRGSSGAAVLLAALTIGGVILWARQAKASEPETLDERFLPPQFVKEANGERFYRAVAAAGSFGPHETLDVFTFKRRRDGSNVYVVGPPGVPPAIIAAAIEAYQVQQVPPQNA